MCFVNEQSSLYENVVFLFVRVWTMPHILYFSCGNPWSHFLFNFSSGVAVKVRKHQKVEGGKTEGGGKATF